MEEEDQSKYNQDQLNQLIQVSHLGAKLSKLQIQQINLQSILKQCKTMINQGTSFRECSNYLQGLGVVYLKQYTLLKSEIIQLQSSMMSKANFVEIENEGNKKKTKSKSVRQKEQGQKDGLLELQEYSESSIDNPRNIAEEGRIQLEQSQRTPLGKNQILRRTDSSDNKIIEESNLNQEVKSVEKESLQELIRNRKNQREQSNKNSVTSKSTPVPRITINTEDGFVEEMIFQEKMDDNNQDYNQDNEEIKSTSTNDNVEIRHKQILKTLENFGLHLYDRMREESEKEVNQEQQKKGIKRKQIHQGLMDEKDKDEISEQYKNNLQQFMKYQDKVDELQIKMNVLNKQTDFWKEKDDLMDLINQFDLQQPNTTELNIKQLGYGSGSKLFGQTTIDNSHQMQEENNNIIEEFDYQQEQYVEMSAQKDKLLENEDLKFYSKLSIDLKKQNNNKSQITSFEYFQQRQNEDQSKAKAFYDLLVMARVGKLKIEQPPYQVGRYSDMIIKF